MTLVDSSAWIEFFRGTGTDPATKVRGLVRSGSSVYTTEPILLELLAGARIEHERHRVQTVLAACIAETVQSPSDWQDAAAVYRACRRQGVTPRKMMDCLIAAVAIRVDIPVLAHDRDFELIARHTPLRIAA